MKNTLLFILLVILLCMGYFLDLKEQKENISLINKKEISELVQISTTRYILKKIDRRWQINDKFIDRAFMQTFIGVLESLTIVQKCFDVPASFELTLKLKDGDIKLKLGQKAIGDNGLYIYKNKQCYLVRNEFTKGLVYSSDQDKGQKQYYMLQNIFNFRETDFKLE